MELLDIRTKDGTVTGVVKERKQVHRDGDLHGTSHVWIVRKGEDGNDQILLQKRAKDKDAYPGFYDISSAGHIPAGDDYKESAIRELKEELGIEAKEEELIFLGMHEGYFEEIFYGEIFKNHEISSVYLYTENVTEDMLQLQEEEVESVRWMDLEECIRRIENEEDGFCLPLDELLMLRRYLGSKNS